MNRAESGQSFDWGQRVRDVGWAVTPDGCWAWLGERLPNGRARIRARVDGRTERRYPYRILYEEAHGPIPAGLVACHTCDHPWCVNPVHIVAATQRRNVEMIRPESRPAVQKAERTRSKILAARARGLTHQAIADQLGVHRVTVSKVLTGAATGSRKAS